MGIFIGDSIYNSGGSGGGGLVYYGLISDSDFMQVENNGFYKYHNEVRNNINFYLDVEENEVLFDIISIENDIVSNINIFILKNGFYYPIPYIGTNSLAAGKNYKLVLLGNSYTVEELTGNINPDLPLYAKINNDNVRIYFSSDNTIIFTEDLSFFSPSQARSYAVNSGTWNLIGNSSAPEFTAFRSSAIPLKKEGWYNGSSWQYVGERSCILYSGSYDSDPSYCMAIAGDDSSDPYSNYGIHNGYRASLVLWKNA